MNPALTILLVAIFGVSVTATGVVVRVVKLNTCRTVATARPSLSPATDQQTSAANWV